MTDTAPKDLSATIPVFRTWAGTVAHGDLRCRWRVTASAERAGCWRLKLTVTKTVGSRTSKDVATAEVMYIVDFEPVEGRRAPLTAEGLRWVARRTAAACVGRVWSPPEPGA